MAQKPLALVVEDKGYWLNIFEQVLEPKFLVKKVRTLGEANTFIESHGKEIEFALVDIKLMGEKPDRSGVGVLQLLRSYGVPSVATSAYYDDDSKAVRDALVLGGAKDFWFKVEMETAELRGLIDSLLAEQSARAEPISKTARIAVPLMVVILALGLALLAFNLVASESGFLMVVSGAIALASLILLFVHLQEPLQREDLRELLPKLWGYGAGRKEGD